MKKISLAVMMMMLSFNVFATPQTKILYCFECAITSQPSITEVTKLQNYDEYSLDVNHENITTIQKMNQQGWSFNSITEMGNKYFVVFTK